MLKSYQVKKNKKNLASRMYDDSSDEESMQSTIPSYDIKKNWQNFNKAHIKKKHAIDDDNLLSFIAHAAGIKLLYSQKVNEHYSLLKAKYLCDEENTLEKQLRELFTFTLTQNMEKIIDNILYFILFCGKKNQPSSIKQLKINSQTKITEFINENIDDLITGFQRARYDLDNIVIFDNCIAMLKEYLLKKLSTIFLFKKNSSNRNTFFNDIYNTAKVIALSLLNLTNDSQLNLAGRQASIELLKSYRGPFQNIAALIETLLLKSHALGHVNTMLLKQLESHHHQTLLSRAYIEDLLQAKTNTNIRKQLSDKDNKHYLAYFSLDEESIQFELDYLFENNLKKSLMETIQRVNRPTLGKHFLFQSTNAYEFYANIRLSNRSQKRQALNIKHAIYPEDSLSRTWRLFNTNNKHMDVVETQQITSLTQARKDKIEGIGNYEKVQENIAQLKKYFTSNHKEIEDSTIALLIRSILNGNVPTLSFFELDNALIIQKLQTIAYLLLGAEVARNPAMIVIHQMLLDLIVSDPDWTFENSFTLNPANKKNQTLPMLPKGAVSTARALELDYQRYMPYPYYYPGIADNEHQLTKKENLISAEATILRAWLLLKYEDLPQSSDAFCDWTLKTIEENFEEWFKQNDNKNKHFLNGA